MDKIKEQATIVSQLLFSGDTGEIYTKTLTRTWDILREIGLLLWLVICLTFVGGEWFYRTAVGLGRSARTWYIGLSEKEPQHRTPVDRLYRSGAAGCSAVEYRVSSSARPASSSAFPNPSPSLRPQSLLLPSPPLRLALYP